MSFDYMDERVLMSSEVFREFAKLDEKMQLEAKAEKLELQAELEEQALQELNAFKKRVASDSSLRAKLRRARDYLVANPEVIERVDSKFVDGVLMLDLDEE